MMNLQFQFVFVLIGFVCCTYYLIIILILRWGLHRVSLSLRTPLISQQCQTQECKDTLKKNFSSGSGKKEPKTTNTFSVIIAAHNEKESIGNCINSVCNQTIPVNTYEVIIVDDRSDDGTGVIVQNYMKQFAHLSLVTVTETPAHTSPKKFALHCGINQAKNTCIVFTDADCVVPRTWLETIDNYFDSSTGFLQGITVYSRKSKNHSLFHGIQALDFLSHGIISASAIGCHIPINSNANNLAFRKEAFTSIQGYGTINHIISGDDDMLLQKLWKTGSWKITFMPDHRGAVETMPTQTINGVIEQRKRWGSKTIYYNFPQRLILSGIFLFYLWIITIGFCSLFSSELILLCAFMMLIKSMGEALLLWPGTALFRQKSLRKYFLLSTVVHLPLVVYSVFMGVFGKFVWKQQQFKRTIEKK